MRSLHTPSTMEPPDTTSLAAFMGSFFNPSNKPQEKLLELYHDVVNQARTVLKECADEIYNEAVGYDDERDNVTEEGDEKENEGSEVNHQDHQDSDPWRSLPPRLIEDHQVTYQDLKQTLEMEEKVNSHPMESEHSCLREEMESTQDTCSEWEHCSEQLEDWEMVTLDCNATQFPGDVDFNHEGLEGQRGTQEVNLDEPSQLLATAVQLQIQSLLPSKPAATRWRLLYSSYRQASSLNLLMNAIQGGDLDKSILLVIQDSYGAVFGAFYPSALLEEEAAPTSSNTFVFTADSDSLHTFPLRGGGSGNQKIVHCCGDYFALGHLPLRQYALWLDKDLRHGSSTPCSSFGSNCLASSPNFSVCDVEVWGI